MTYRCAVIGNPIVHSQSPQIHAAFAAKQGIDLQYDKILATEENFTAIVQDFFAQGGHGLNITLPFKERAYALAQNLSPYARTAGAVNTLWMENGELCGDNTDGRGLVRALSQQHGIDLSGKRLLLLGAGGAARGVILPLLEAQVSQIDILNRSPDKARVLADLYAERVAAVEHPAQGYDLIINATSAGLGDSAFTLSPTTLHEQTLCYDMMYGKQTPFMQWAAAQGCTQIADGYSMLENQAWLAFHIWFGTIIKKDNI